MVIAENDESSDDSDCIARDTSQPGDRENLRVLLDRHGRQTPYGGVDRQYGPCASGRHFLSESSSATPVFPAGTRESLRRLDTEKLSRGSWRVSPPEIGLTKLVGDIRKVLHHPALTLL